MDYVHKKRDPLTGLFFTFIVMNNKTNESISNLEEKCTVNQVRALHALARALFDEKLNALHIYVLNKHFGTRYVHFGQISKNEARRMISTLQALQLQRQSKGGEIYE